MSQVKFLGVTQLNPSLLLRWNTACAYSTLRLIKFFELISLFIQLRNSYPCQINAQIAQYLKTHIIYKLIAANSGLGLITMPAIGLYFSAGKY